MTPGFTIKDANGQRWFLKFDPRGYRGMATGTEVAVTKLMWALGYHVPENHIAYMRREQLAVGDGATFTPLERQASARCASDDLDTLLGRADREPDGSYRVVASKALDGKPIGRIRFLDTRPDDPERHRAARASARAARLRRVRRVAQSRGREGDQLARHAGHRERPLVRPPSPDRLRIGARQRRRRAGGLLGGLASTCSSRASSASRWSRFGFAYPKWHTTSVLRSAVDRPAAREQRDFDPEAWKPRVPNQAFLHARADDKFWAAQKLMALSTEHCCAQRWRAGDFGDPASEAFLVRALAERRDAIGRAYLTAINPIADPALSSDGTLTFRNAAVDADVAQAPDGYRAEWFRFDNATAQSTRIGETVGRTTKLEAPHSLPRRDGTFVHVKVSSVGALEPSWEKPMDVFFRYQDGQWQLVGVDRIPS